MGKRLFDITLSVVGLAVFLPLFILISILIILDSRGPVLFKQVRIGMGGREFKILKFRTMVVNAEKLGKQLTIGKDSRVTQVGRLLRKAKLDELPQLWNVLIGDMSIVGPRPEVPRYTELYTKEQRAVLEVRPGITDYASIKYMDENELLEGSSDPERLYIEQIMIDKLNINLDYIDRRSFWMDIKVIIYTFTKIVSRRGRKHVESSTNYKHHT